MARGRRLGEGGGDEVEDLGGDLLLAAFVVGEGEVGDEVLGVVGSDLHRKGAGGVLGGVSVEEHGVELQEEDLREEMLHEGEWVRLEEVVDRFLGAFVIVVEREWKVVLTDHRL